MENIVTVSVKEARALLFDQCNQSKSMVIRMNGVEMRGTVKQLRALLFEMAQYLQVEFVEVE